ncbi:MAG: ribosome silencing factor [Anaerolineae bacterium]|nr:ribosome silencing factor [Anaerolineae bacterium]
MVDILSDKMGEDILLLEISSLTTVADYFIICSGSSERQLQTLASTVREQVKKETGLIPSHVEGNAPSGWILMDYGGIVVHIFAPELRLFYDLEELWQEGRVVVRVQ